LTLAFSVLVLSASIHHRLMSVVRDGLGHTHSSSSDLVICEVDAILSNTSISRGVSPVEAPVDILAAMMTVF